MRYALGVEYDGSEFKGWQQLGEGGRVSVQATLQDALSKMANAPITVVCAGRTDAGVHGECQVVHFDSEVERSPRNWVLGTTAHLPPSICVRWCVPVDDAFHARFSAKARRYRYRLLNRQIRPALYRQILSWERRALDADAMHRAAQRLVGENDFGAFRSSQCQATHGRRHLHEITVSRQGDVVEVQVQANAFLHHMVRNIVGSLLMVGAGEKPEEWISELLAGCDRNLAGPTAPPQGLVFVGPLYSDAWQLPAEVTL
ncbi:MAG: tRNA pseudouridine(38-40) synthase TruA [Stenotrophomonas sp.]|uniref:tRNA pseudouridine(38-40) synthase TruA n=1 Tax=Stenotrophomonas sp. TaxID=69392 RepID=UPI003D6CCCE1